MKQRLDFFKRKKVNFTRAIEFSQAICQDEYFDLNIKVYIPEAMEKARVFAIAYEKVSGKKSNVIRAYQKKEDVEKLLPQVKVARKSLNPEITPEDLKNFGITREDRAVQAFDSPNSPVQDIVDSKVVENKNDCVSYSHPIRPWMW